MDDPLQSLDDVNVLGFSDLMAQLRNEKQVFLSTHEERFARLLERKLTMSDAGGSTIVHRFLGWSREGPRVDTRVLPGRSAIFADSAS
jgi:ABC-type lipoprotein export system ATPase subunit